MYPPHIQRHTTQGRRGTSAGRRARPLQQHRAPRRCTGVDGTSSCLTGSLSLAKPRGGDVVGDKRQRLLVSFDSTRPSDSVGCARRAACRDERVRHLPGREGMPQLHGGCCTRSSPRPVRRRTAKPPEGQVLPKETSRRCLSSPTTSPPSGLARDKPPGEQELGPSTPVHRRGARCCWSGRAHVRPRCHGVPVLCGVVCELGTPSTLHHKL